MENIIIVGLGPLGIKTTQFALERKNLKVAGAVDIDPAIVGKDLGTYCGLSELGISISPDMASAVKGKEVDCAVLTTVSSIEKLEAQVAEAVDLGLNVVSSCEELAFAWKAASEASKRIDALCKDKKVTCLGTGVNPGFLMDFLPSVMTAVSQNVQKVIIERVQDASVRRIPFQQKIGSALTTNQFEAKKKEGTLRHVGLTESVDMIAHALNWNLDSMTESLDPVMAEADVTTGYKPIEKGMARGVEQIARAYKDGEEVMTLTFRAAVGEPRSYDRIEIHGNPNIVSEISGGVNGDVATCAIMLNAVRSAVAAESGLRTMLDVPAVACAG